MPYTPPSVSPSATPGSSRRPSAASDRPALPRSSSYMLHRRARSSSSVSLFSASTPASPASSSSSPQSSSHRPSAPSTAAASEINENIRQSPSPVTSTQSIPVGAIISPPESGSSEASDEEVSQSAADRGRKLNEAKVQKLKDAVSLIPQLARTGSPDRGQSSKDGNAEKQEHQQRRKMGHVRSVTEPNASFAKASDSSVMTSEEDSEGELVRKPQMVRKKSGELVRPALRPAHRRPSSMPGTPTFSKAVHFDSHLEHVRHFLQVDRPLAVSAGSSPVDNYDSDTEFPFGSNSGSGSGSSNNGRSALRSPTVEWELNTRNFPQDSPARRALAVRLEKVWLSPSDQKSLIGSVVVSNLDFHKSVVCRFTLDYWKTTSEVAAEFSQSIVPKDTPQGHDRFTFSIKLSDMANLESKTLYFCIRFGVSGTDYWDNNAGANFQIDFKKKVLSQLGTSPASSSANGRPRSAGAALPRSNRRSHSSTAVSTAASSSSSSSPASAAASASASASAAIQSTSTTLPPTSFDDLVARREAKKPIHEVLGETGPPGLRFKVKSATAIPSDSLPTGLGSPSGQAFANRYDFGASLRAVTASKDEVSQDDILYMKSRRGSPSPAAAVGSSGQSSGAAPGTSSAPSTLPAPGTSSSGLQLDSKPFDSKSYEELVSRYCFFGSKQSSSPTVSKDGSFRTGNLDGAVGSPVVPATTVAATQPPAHILSGGSSPAHTLNNGPSPTLSGGPGPAWHHAGPAQSHSMFRDPNSYFDSYMLKSSPAPSPPVGSAAKGGFRAVAASSSPGQSPLAGPSSASSSPRTTVTSTPRRSSSPASSLAGTWGAGNDDFFHGHSQFHGGFPFNSHPATAIRG